MKKKKRNDFYSNENYYYNNPYYNINYIDYNYSGYHNYNYKSGETFYTDYSMEKVNDIFNKYVSEISNLKQESEIIESDNQENIERIVNRRERNENFSNEDNAIEECHNNVHKVNVGQQTKDITKELIEQSYECIVCSEELKFDSEIWNCKTCFTLTHIKCIQDWIKKLNTNNEGEVFKFTCPHCLCVHKVNKDKLPVYNCFCEKYNSKNYKQTSNIYIPHSCGKSCDYKICDHLKCELPCHPGPHLQCHESVMIDCFCGKESKSVICNSLKNSSINQLNIIMIKNVPKFMCKSVCGKSLLCGNHSCKLICHDGECAGNIPVYDNLGNMISDHSCESCLEESKLKIKNVLEQINFMCLENGLNIDLVDVFINLIFDGILPCNFHTDEKISVTKRLNDFLMVLKISDGKNLLFNLRNLIPLCKSTYTNVCKCKTYKKSGICYLMNYNDDLIEFLNLTQEKLNFIKNDDIQLSIIDEMTNSNIVKKFTKIIILKECSKPCKTFKSCKIHTCMNICCPLKGKIVNNYSEETGALHLCFEKCGKLLECGIHTCIDNCHSGNCYPCFNIIKDKSLICDCGSFVLEAPYRCNTIPECLNPCSKERLCSHGCKENCHRGPCKPCQEIVTKSCNCRKSLIENLKCSDEAKCKKQCEELLPCGVHFCKTICHEHLEDPNFICKQICNRIKACGHKCSKICHGEDECIFEDCEINVKAFCKCNQNTKLVKCSDVQKKNKEKENDLFYKHVLDCNDVCAQFLRKSKIEEAFKGLKDYSDEKNKMFVKRQAVMIENDDEGELFFENFCELKFTHEMIYFAKKNPKIISDLEEFIENYLSNITKSTLISNIDKFPCDKKFIPIVSDIINNIYNLKTTKSTHITIVPGGSARLPRYRLSLFGLLFKHSKFIRSEFNIMPDEYDEDWEKQYDLYDLHISYEEYYKKFKIIHPFEQSILVKNIKLCTSLQDLEVFLLKYKIVSSDSIFYLDYLDSQQTLIHFFDHENCENAFKKLSSIPSQFQDCYLLDRYSSVENNVKLAREMTNKDFMSSIYKYKKNQEYFKLLEDENDYLKAELEQIRKKKMKEEDEDGFIIVKK